MIVTKLALQNLTVWKFLDRNGEGDDAAVEGCKIRK